MLSLCLSLRLSLAQALRVSVLLLAHDVILVAGPQAVGSPTEAALVRIAQLRGARRHHLRPGWRLVRKRIRVLWAWWCGTSEAVRAK